MLNPFIKSALSGGLTLVGLLWVGTPTLAQSVDGARARQLADIAFGYAIADQPAQAIPLLKQAETYQGGDCFEANTWLKIGVGYQAAGQPEQGDKYLARAAETAAARTLENCASSATPPSTSLLNRTIEYAEAGHRDLALHIADRVDAWTDPLTMALIATEYSEAGQPQQAKQIITRSVTAVTQALAKESEATPTLALLLLGTAGQLTYGDQPELATLMLEESGLAQLQPSADSNLLETNLASYQFLDLVRFLIDLDQQPQALAFLDSAVSIIQTPAQLNWEGLHELVDAAVLYRQLDSRQAEPIFEQVNASLSQLPHDQQRASIQAALVEGYADLGDFEQARSLAASIGNTNERQNAHRMIAAAYAKAGLAAEANDFVQSMGEQEIMRVAVLRAYLATGQYDHAQQITDRPDMVKHLPEAGHAYCDAGLPERVIPIINRLEPASEPADWMRRCAAIEFARKGQPEIALLIAETSVDPEAKARLLVAIATQQPPSLPKSAWQRLMGWLPHSVQTWFGTSESQKTVEILDEALSLIQEKT
ncbi:MAG: hypothetical protein AAF282_06990 [Cyanobacteria bacterium P01_A01_bin.15]